MPLRYGEHEECGAAAEERAADDVGEPVDLEVRATPRHADDGEGGESPPASAVRPDGGEEEDERDGGGAGIGGMAGGERRADRVDEPAGRAGAIDQCLEQRGEQRREGLGDRECGEREPAMSPEEEKSHERQRDGAAESASEPVEDEREIGEEWRLEAMHRLGPAAVEVERSDRYEDGDKRNEGEHSAGRPERMIRMREKRLS
jgi:hypothetical protein